MTPREFFSREIKLNDHQRYAQRERHIKEAIQFIEEEYGIIAFRNELMIEIKRKYVESREFKYFLSFEPTQSLLQKFKKDYPEFLI